MRKNNNCHHQQPHQRNGRRMTVMKYLFQLATISILLLSSVNADKRTARLALIQRPDNGVRGRRMPTSTHFRFKQKSDPVTEKNEVSKDPVNTTTKDPVNTTSKDPAKTTSKDPEKTASKDPAKTASKDPAKTTSKDPAKTTSKDPEKTASKDPAKTLREPRVQWKKPVPKVMKTDENIEYDEPPEDDVGATADSTFPFDPITTPEPTASPVAVDVPDSSIGDSSTGSTGISTGHFGDEHTADALPDALPDAQPSNASTGKGKAKNKEKGKGGKGKDKLDKKEGKGKGKKEKWCYAEGKKEKGKGGKGGKGGKAKDKGKGKHKVTCAPTAMPTLAVVPDVFVINDCDAISLGTAPTTGNSVKFNVGMDLTIRGGYDIVSIMESLTRALQQIVAPAVAGCPTNSRKLMSDDVNTKDGIVNVVFEDGKVVGSCTPSIPGGGEVPVGASCHETEQVVSIYLNDGVDPPADLRQRLLDELEKFDISLPGLLNIADITVTPVDDTDRNSGTFGDTNTGEKGRSGLGVPGWIALCCSVATILIVLALFANDKRKQDAFDHVPFDDDDDITKDYAKDIASDEASEGHTTTATEEFNIAADWDTPVYLGEEEPGFFTTSDRKELHTCASAIGSACAACELERNRDLTFVPTGRAPEAPSRSPDLPTSAKREYTYESTVLL